MTLKERVADLRGKLYELAMQQRAALERFEQTGVNEPDNERKRTEDINKIEEEIRDLEHKDEQRAINEARLAALGRPTDKPLDRTRSAERDSKDISLLRRSFGEYAKDVDLADPIQARKFAGLNEFITRDFTLGNNVQAGTLAVPIEIVDTIVKPPDNTLTMGNLVDTRMTNALSLGFPSLDADVGDMVWDGEEETPAADEAAKIGLRELKPKGAKLKTKLSYDFVRLAGNGAAFVLDRMRYKMRVGLEKMILTGDGVNKGLGVFTPSASGVSTARDIASGGNTSISTNALFSAKHSIDPAHYGSPGFAWVMDLPVLSYIRQIKNAVDGSYVWMPGISNDLPPRILETRYIISRYAPSTMTANLYVAVIGDFRMVMHAMNYDTTLQILDQLYAETNKIGYLMRMRCDAMPVLSTAFARIKMTA